MGQTYQLYIAMLKEFYGSTFQETFNNENMLKKYLEESEKVFDGLRVNYPVHTARNSGIGARAEGAPLPTAGYQGYDSVYVTAAYLYGRINLTGQAMAASKKTAFAEAMGIEMEGVKTDLMFDVGRMCYGEGLGVLGRSYNTNSCTAINLSNQYAAPGNPGARFLDAGQLVDIGSAGNPDALTPTGPLTVSSVTISTNSGTVYDVVNLGGTDGTSVMTTDSFVFSVCAGGPGIELKGLRAMIDDQTATNCYGFTGGFYNNDTIFNVDRNTVAGWNSYVDQNSGVERLINNTLLQRAESRAVKKGGKKINLYFGEYDVVDAFLDSVAGDRRFNTKNFDAGVDTLTFNGKTMVKDLNAPYNEIYGLNSDAIKWYTLLPFGFDDLDGSVLKNVSGYDKHEAFIKGYMQLAPGEDCAPNSCLVVRDIKTNIV